MPLPPAGREEFVPLLQARRQTFGAAPPDPHAKPRTQNVILFLKSDMGVLHLGRAVTLVDPP